MGKRKGTLLSFTSLLFAFMLSTLFFYLVYNRLFDSAADAFSGIVVMGPSYESEPDIQKQQKFVTMRNELAAWASKHRAVLFYKEFSAAGIAAIDYAGWFDGAWNVSFTGQEPKTAIVQRTRRNLDSYIEDDVLFPGVYNYRIIGEFGAGYAPTFQGEAFFYYPLTDITDMEGLLYTNITDSAALFDLCQIIRASGRSAAPQSTDQLNLWEMIFKLFTEDFVSRSMLFTFLGLIFCAAFAVYMMNRESNRYMVIHHLYGATYLSLFIRTLLNLIGVAVLGTFLGYILGKTQLNLIRRAAYVEVAVFSGICNILFACLVQLLCFIDWVRKNHGKEGRY